MDTIYNYYIIGYAHSRVGCSDIDEYSSRNNNNISTKASTNAIIYGAKKEAKNNSFLAIKN